MREATRKNSELIHPLKVDTLHVDPNERFDFLNDIYAREKLILAPNRALKKEVSAGSTLWDIGSLRFAVTHSSGHIGRRIRSDKAPVLAIRQHFRGGCHSWAEDGHYVTRPGDMIVTINTVDGIHACNDLGTVNIVIPLEALEFDWRLLKTTFVLPANALGNRLLTVAIDQWRRELEHFSQERADQMWKEIVGLVNHVLRTDQRTLNENEICLNLRGRAMRRYINDHLMDQTLDVGVICRFFGTSRASVYRAFAEEGGLRQYIVRRRLRKAMTLLGANEDPRGRVSAVAAQVGYDDPLHFSRAFFDYFGFRPSELLSLR